MQDITELMVGEEAPQEGRELHGALGQWMIGKHSRVEVAEEIAHGSQGTEMLRERAFALPGWGQFYTGHTVRGFLYGGAEVAFATAGFYRQSQVLDQRDEIFQAKLDFVAADQALHPDSAYSKEDTLALYDRFEGTAEGLALENELHDKQKSREDFFTYAIFTVLFSAIDAFVSAHLEPFDTAKLDVRPAEDGWRLDVRLPLGRRSGTRGSSAPDAMRSEFAADP